MQIQIAIESTQEKYFELAAVLHGFATDYENWMIKSIKAGKLTLRDEGGDLIGIT
jgi:hypothetical protein